MNKIYGFTNECVSAYPSIYNFDGSNVLSVLGSGDQYFTAILNGAKNVDVFDLNMVAWYHFLLKFNAIKYFTYEEFYKFFVTYNLNDLNDYLKLRNYLPDYAKEFFDNLYKQHKQLSSIKISNIFFDNYDMENYQRIIPYFNNYNYYKLQSILNNTGIPEFYAKPLEVLANARDLHGFDLCLFSNICDWLGTNPTRYKKLIESFDADIIQAHYLWKTKDIDLPEFISLGFEKSLIPAVNESKKNKYNTVLTLKRVK